VNTVAVAQVRGIVVGLDKMNTLYVGVNNPMKVAVSDIPEEHLQLIPSIGTMSAPYHTHFCFEWQICHFDTNVASLVIRDTVNGLLNDTLHFNIKYPPEPELLWRRTWHHREEPSSLARGVALELNFSDFDLIPRVKGYHFMVLRKGQDVRAAVNYGDRPNEQVSSLMDSVVPGDRVRFYKIKYTVGCDPEIRYHSGEIEYLIRG
jgi:hypothetical protein